MKQIIYGLSLFFLIAVAFIFTGCGDNQTSIDDGSNVVVTAPRPAVEVDILDPKVPFNQIALKTPAKTIIDSHGMSYYSFKYTDEKGRVNQTTLPYEMTKGEYTKSVWILTFNAYQNARPIKVVKAKNPIVVADFPFVSPRPVVIASTSAANANNGGGLPSPGGMAPPGAQPGAIMDPGMIETEPIQEEAVNAPPPDTPGLEN